MIHGQHPVTPEAKMELILAQVRRNAIPVRAEHGSTAGDRQQTSSRLMNKAIDRIAQRFGVDREAARQIIEARDQIGYLGYVESSHAIIRENSRRENRF